MNYSNIDDIIGGFDKVLNLSSIGTVPPIPVVLMLIGVPQRSGLSPTKIAARIIARKSEAGIPVGTLPSGEVAPDEIMETIRMEELIYALQQESVISVAIPMGIPITAAGTSPAGPVIVQGSSVAPIKGWGIIQ